MESDVSTQPMPENLTAQMDNCLDENAEVPGAVQKETLVSDTCQEKFRDEFEFSVAVEPRQTEETTFERVISITKSSDGNDNKESPMNESDKQIAIELSQSSIAARKEIHFESTTVPSTEGQDGSREIATSVIQDELLKREPKDEIKEAVDKTVNDQAVSNQQPVVDGEHVKSLTEGASHVSDSEPIFAQHSLSGDTTIKAEREPELVIKKEPPSETDMSEVAKARPDSSKPQEVALVVGRRESHVSNKSSESASKPASIASEDKTKHTKKPLFHFKIKQAKKENVSTDKPEEKSLGDSAPSAFSVNVKKMIQNIRRTASQKQRSSSKSKPTVKPVTRPPRPPPLNATVNHQPAVHSSMNGLDQLSLRSVSGPSLSGSPEVSKRRLIQQALPDFIAAMPTDTAVTVTENGSAKTPDKTDDQLKEELVLAHVASNIAHSISSVDNQASKPSVSEENIRPVKARQFETVSAEAGVAPTSNYPQPQQGRSALPPKPPRPNSPPVLSPLDYQPYNETPGHQELVAQRMAMMQIIQPQSATQSEVYVAHSPPSARKIPGKNTHSQYETEVQASSMDYIQNKESPQYSPVFQRRAQTLRTDYASLVRERVRSLRLEPSESCDTGSVGPLKLRPKRENYTCTETIKLPKLSMKLRRRQTEKPKTVHSGGQSPLIGRPQPRVMSEYRSNEVCRVPRADIQSDYVVVSQVGVVQSAMPPITPPDIHARIQNGTYNSRPNQTLRAVTSLRSVGADPSVRQQTYLITSPGKGLLQKSQQAPQSTQELQPIPLPYYSASLLDALGSDVPCDSDASRTTLDKALRKSQQFLTDWDQMSQHPVEFTEDLKEATKTVMSEFLGACVRLRSVDLQGVFSPFHYPLPSFDVKLWRKCAKLANWTQLNMLNEPEWNTDYVHMDTACAKQLHLVYSERSVDTMLTNWLDCHNTSPTSPDIYVNADGWTCQTSFLHPVQLASDLDSILESKPYADYQKNELIHDCLRLAVLLAYEDCCATFKKFNTSPGTDLKNVLMVLSSSNCLVIFRSIPVGETLSNGDQSVTDGVKSEETSERRDEKADVSEQTTDSLIKAIYPDQPILEKAIDELIGKVYQLTADCVAKSGQLPTLLKSVAPPDWIAMLIARVFVSR